MAKVLYDGRKVTNKQRKKISDWKKKHGLEGETLGKAVKKPEGCKTNELHARTFKLTKYNYAGECVPE